MVKYSINKHSNFLLNNLIKNADGLGLIIKKGPLNSMIVDAGIGAPSHAARAMEMGADAVLVNTAIAASQQPVEMAIAFKLAVEAGRMAYLAGLAGQVSHAVASSPLTSFLDE